MTESPFRLRLSPPAQCNLSTTIGKSMNPISAKLHIGTIGELLVQLRLLECGVQAAAPLKDSGNDLIAIWGDTFRAISVRTTTGERFRKPPTERSYHLLAVVQLIGEDSRLYLDESQVFLIPREDVMQSSSLCANLTQYRFSAQRVANLFGIG